MDILGDLLPVYYARLFPFQDYYRWLSYGKQETFSRREFSFTLQEDVYLRFQSFRDLKHMEAEIKRLVPFKIDIGAVYNISPKEEKKAIKFQPIERELVFDIDMTDYDEVRNCCSGAEICKKCWKFMVIACKILDAALREDFGYNHILWVFSGRRGIHGWVCDDRARSLEVAARTAVAEYLQILSGGDFMAKKINLFGDKVHHSIRRAIELIKPRFVTMCIEEQDILGTDEAVAKFLELLPDEEVKSEVKNLFDKYSKSVDRWDAFTKYYTNQMQSGLKKWRSYRHFLEEIMLQYTYPRLDIHVSKGMNHLLKSPFCVHPQTGKVCIPLNPKTIEKFDPMTVPTISVLIDEINTFDAKDKAVQGEHSLATKRIKDYKKTSLNKSLHLFQEFLRGLEDSRKAAKLKQQDVSLDF
ncbi:DNA primase small subunit [Venturia canescens]|uniref:DNA primase small subunit n=1 Tax=Venturia canescens TaxID=32260 RepID=UPI001C9D558A|nr:DNA primase small subunit [Venturia canescens]